MALKVVVDFDGTITMQDVSDLILAQYRKGDWKAVERDAVNGHISMNECISQQFRMIYGDPEDIKSTALAIPLRKGFVEFLSYCEDHEVEVICLSAGLSFIIDEFFKVYDIYISYIAPKSEIIGNNVQVETIDVVEEYDDFKHQVISKLQGDNHQILYLGDGSSDYCAIKYADYRFAITDSTLSKELDRDGLHYHSFDNFNQLIELINQFDIIS